MIQEQKTPANKSTGHWFIQSMTSNLPLILLPSLLFVSTISLTATIMVMITIGLGAWFLQRSFQKKRSHFFYSWTLTSIIILFEVYKYNLWLGELTVMENRLFLTLSACMCLCYHKMKSVAFQIGSGKILCGLNQAPFSTKYCHSCEVYVEEKYFHSLWWDCCISRTNYSYYIFGHMFAFIVLFYGIYLVMTTLCHCCAIGPILVPTDCSFAYDKLGYSFPFVSCVYAACYLSVTAMYLMEQICYLLPSFILKFLNEDANGY